MRKFKTILYVAVLSLSLFGMVACGTSGEAIDAELKKTCQELNKDMPMMIDEYTRLDSMSSTPGRIANYHYSLVQHDVDFVTPEDISTFDAQMKEELISNIKNNPDMDTFRKHDVILKYYYNDGNGKYFSMVEILPEEYK